MAKFILPSESAIKNTLGLLYGDIEVSEGKSTENKLSESTFAAMYVDDDNNPVAACICDTPFAAYTGAALSMMPPGVAEEAATAKELPENMWGNLHEVMNIYSKLLMDEKTPHLKLDSVYTHSELPAESASAMESMTQRTDYVVSVPRYGSGCCWFLSV